MRLPAAPRMRRYVVPVPIPFSLHDIIPGVREKRYGSSRPVVEKSFSSDFSMFATANGAFFCALTAFTTTSLSKQAAGRLPRRRQFRVGGVVKKAVEHILFFTHIRIVAI